MDYRTDPEGKSVKFGRNTYDCVGVFSSGSLTGIIVSILLASVFIFGFLMLNSVQTMDRFDDPKQKQLTINSKE
jgi:V-type H+-transporting ATPase S1 subunit